MDVVYKKYYPFRLTFLARQSNSHYFSNIADVNLQFNRSMFYQQLKEDLLKQIDEAYAGRDLGKVKIAAHSLKPQLSYMGVKEDISHIFLIEQTASEAGHADRLPPLIANLNRVCQKAFDELNQLKQ